MKYGFYFLFTDENNIQQSQNSLILSQSQNTQTGLMMNYINKEPFNEDLEVEECSLYNQDMKWRSEVFDKFKAIINDLKILKTNPVENVRQIQ